MCDMPRNNKPSMSVHFSLLSLTIPSHNNCSYHWTPIVLGYITFLLPSIYDLLSLFIFSCFTLPPHCDYKQLDKHEVFFFGSPSPGIAHYSVVLDKCLWWCQLSRALPVKDRKQNKRKIHPTYSILEKEFEISIEIS